MGWLAPDSGAKAIAPSGGGGWGDAEVGWTAPKAERQYKMDMDAQGYGIDEYPSMLDMLFFNFGTATGDSTRGIAQWSGYDSDQLRQQQATMEKYMNHPEYGARNTAAYYTGLLLDPVGWALPASRLKHLKTAKDFFTRFLPLSATGGAVSGATGYIPEGTESLVGEGDMTRTEMGALGAAAGTVGAPVLAGVGKGVKKIYEPIGDVAWEAIKHPAGATGTVGGLVGFNAEPDASFSDKVTNMAVGAVIGGNIGAAPKAIDKMRGNTELSDKMGHLFIDNFKMSDDYLEAMNRFRGRQNLYAQDFKSVLDGIRDMPIKERQVLYRMLQSKRFGMGTDDFDLDKLGIASESRAKIQEYGQALVNLGVLDEKTFLKNIDDYLSTSYVKHDMAKGAAGDPINMLYNSHHMFKMRGKVENFDKVQWERGQRPDDIGEWEVIQDGGGQFKVRRQWTKAEKKSMGEIEDAAYAMQKTARMMGHERALGEFFKELSMSPDVVVDVGVKVPNNRGWGALGGKQVSSDTWEQLQKLRKFTPKSTTGDWIRRYKTTNAVWKGLKTIAAPPVHFANFVSSGHMFDMANGDWADVGRAARSMYKGDEMYDKMVEDGVLGTSFVQELRSGGADDLLRLYGNDATGYLRIGDGPNGLNRAMDWTTRVMRFVKGSTWDNAAKLYQLEDNIWRASLYHTKYKEAIGNGMTEMKARGYAARQAKDFFVDYDKNPPVLNALRHTFLPFFSYTYGTMPRLAEIAAKNPAKYAKWAMIYGGMNQLGEYVSGEDDYVLEKVKDTVRRNPIMGMPFMPNARVTLPEAASDFVAPDSDDIQSLNTERWMPGGTFSLSEGGTGQIPYVPDMVQPSGGVAGAVGWPLLGINQFQGTNIPEGRKLDAMVKNLLPNWPGIDIGGIMSYAEQKVRRADSGETSRTQDDYSPLSARLSNAGIRIEPLNQNKISRRIKMKYDQKLNDISREMRRIRRERSYSDAEKEKRMEAQRKKRREVKEDMRRALGND